MMRLGFLLTDLSALYVLREMRIRWPNLAGTVLYDPISPSRRDKEEVEAYVDKNRARLQNLGGDEMIILGENVPGANSWEAWLSQMPEDSYFLHSPYREEGMALPLYYYLAEDGLMQRNFALHILYDYLEHIPYDRGPLVLASPGMNYWQREWEKWAKEEKITLLDPMDAMSLPEDREVGGFTYYWTTRDFTFERRVQEILEEKIQFHYYREKKWKFW